MASGIHGSGKSVLRDPVDAIVGGHGPGRDHHLVVGDRLALMQMDERFRPVDPFDPTEPDVDR